MAPLREGYNLNQVIANTPVIILWGEPAGDRSIDFVTDNIGLYGYTVPEIVMDEAPFDKILLKEDRERVDAAFREALAEKRPSLLADYRIVDKAGRAHWVEDRTTFYYDRGGEAVLYQSCLMDISDRKLAEERLSLLHDTSMAFMEELDPGTLVRQILDKALEFAGASDGLVSVMEGGGESRRITWGEGLFKPLVGMSIPMDRGFMAEVLKEGRRIVIDDYHSYRGRMDMEEFRDITTIIGIPLHRGRRILGAITTVFRDEVRAIDEHTLDQMDQFAAAASIALENARLYEETRREAEERQKAERRAAEGYGRLQNIFSDVIRTMGKIVGKKDPYTVGHQERVALLAGELGKRAGLDDTQCEGLRIAGLVHDIGKIEIPGEILSKPGTLSRIEFELIKTHAQSGYDILKEVDFPWPVAGIVRQHHERLDGSGYPQGLRGSETLPEARILAVADVVESMMSYRPYRPALGLKAALDEIRAKRNELYDPEAVDACLDLFNEQPGFISEG
ncbi:MAG: HD domain-containing phosphohydrolase [Aminivibrio sp.]|jgi:PAS domain S-box-containing protein/putative nucleotidyltransferase with HDIG domain|nr:HD domain-containing protein [Synergistaceae bacterium]